MELKQVEKIAKALGDINRLKILQYMHQHDGRVECMELGNIINLAQPSISHHIKKLTEAGLIEPQKDGRYYLYTLNQTTWQEYVQAIQTL
ncbi:ArsR/SmtB family transcription factor [Adhaeribacter aquaticus]|uniref:ArsR/SmtB family transcription factor n=1 Tax=Adhaeribacter aquaticus TaxID=299567 RepID=UPI0003F8AC87|nr:winged helix-turn-helix domain-containing protein [Adhaeribacter aquaticus]